MAKYRNRTFENEFGRWDSQLEYYRYLVLRDAESRGEITGLQRQRQYELIPAQQAECVSRRTVRNGTTVKRTLKTVEKSCTYRADFTYFLSDGTEIVEDTKGYRTKEYVIKRKLMRLQGHPIREVRNANEPILLP